MTGATVCSRVSTARSPAIGRGARGPSRRSWRAREVGTVTSLTTGIAKVSGPARRGLRGAGAASPAALLGIAFNVDEDEIGVVLLGDYGHLKAGDEVERTGRVMDVPVGDGLLGRVIDPLGRPLDGKGRGGQRTRPAHRATGAAHHGPRARSRCPCRPGSKSSTR